MTGWSLEYIGDLEWNVVCELDDYWQDYPPVHILLAAVHIPDSYRKARRRTGLNKVERAFMEEAERTAKPFDSLPPHVQAALWKYRKEPENPTMPPLG